VDDGKSECIRDGVEEYASVLDSIVHETDEHSAEALLKQQYAKV
jgi:hypothetical protein